MHVRQEGLSSQYSHPFDDTLRPSLPTVAEPPWFAPPIDVRQDDGEMTLLFQVTQGLEDDLRVDANGRSVFVWGSAGQEGAARKAIRVFALPFEFAPRELETSRSGDVLRVRVPRKRGSAAHDTTSS